MPDKEMDKIEFDNLVIRIENLMMDLDTAQTRYVGQTGRQYVPPLRLAPRKRKESFEDSILREEARAMPYARNCEAELRARLIPETSTPCAHKNQRHYSGMICHDCGKPQY